MSGGELDASLVLRTAMDRLTLAAQPPSRLARIESLRLTHEAETHLFCAYDLSRQADLATADHLALVIHLLHTGEARRAREVLGRAYDQCRAKGD